MTMNASSIFVEFPILSTTQHNTKQNNNKTNK